MHKKERISILGRSRASHRRIRCGVVLVGIILFLSIYRFSHQHVDLNFQVPTHQPTTELSPEGDCLIFTMNSEFEKAWRTSSKRDTFPTQVTQWSISKEEPHDQSTTHLSSDWSVKGSATFYGKSSLKIRYTSKRSLHILLDSAIVVEGVSIRSFLLLSLWEDKYRLAYLSSAQILAKLGLFSPVAKLVELRCAGEGSVCHGLNTLGAYLLVEYPTEAILRTAAVVPVQRPCETEDHFSMRSAVYGNLSSFSVEVATRNWFYFEKPPKYDLLHVPSYHRNSTLSKAYRKIEVNPDVLTTQDLYFDLHAYLSWVVVNTLLKNGDYDDEVFFYSVGSRFVSIMAWDYDNVFTPCHRKGATAIKTDLMYCAETPLERKILENRHLRELYLSTAVCLTREVLTVEAWTTAVAASAHSLEGVAPEGSKAFSATFSGENHAVSTQSGAKELLALYESSRAAFLLQLPNHRPSLLEEQVDGTVATALMQDKHQYTKQLKDLTEECIFQQRLLKVQREYKGVAHIQLATHATSIEPDATITFHKKGTEATFASSGFHCLGTASCGPLSIFVVRSEERGSSEFGVPHFLFPSRRVLLDEHVAEIGERSLQITVPSMWPHFADGFPMIVQVVDSRGTWVRENTLVLEHNPESLVVRGFSALRVAKKSSNGPTLFLPEDDVLHFGPQRSPVVRPERSYRGVRSVFDPSRNQLYGGPDCILEVPKKVVVEGTVRIGEGCVLLLHSGVVLSVVGTLIIEGSTQRPVVIVGSEEAVGWNSIIVSGTGSFLNMSHCFVTGSGVKGKLFPGTGKHHKHSAAVTVTSEGTASFHRCYFVDLRGPAIAAGVNSHVSVAHSVVQWAEMGIECVGCNFSSFSSVWTHFPNWDAHYVDGDNDAMYLSGGHHQVVGSVIAHSQDDGIDSGTPERSAGDGGSLLVDRTIIEMIRHEGIALSSAPKAKRTAVVQNSMVRYAQQGIESGYTGEGHRGVVENCIIEHCNVGVRYGDNYFKRPQLGSLTVRRSMLDHNKLNFVNYLRSEGASAPNNKFLFEGNIAGHGSDESNCSALFANPSISDGAAVAINGREDSFLLLETR